MGAIAGPEAGDRMRGSYLGPSYDDAAVVTTLDAVGAAYTRLADDELFPRLAEILDGEKIVGWFQGRMEFGARALGCITPTGIVMRIARRRRIPMRFDRELPSYRIISRPLPRKRMEKPF